MPKKGPAFHVDDNWRDRVRSRLAERAQSLSDLARVVDMPKSTLSELMNGLHQQTPFLPEIHAALGWDPPQPPLPSKDAGEVMYLWERMDDVGKQRMLDKGRSRLDELLKRAKKPS
jgi:hypothetical protein